MSKWKGNENLSFKGRRTARVCSSALLAGRTATSSGR